MKSNFFKVLKAIWFVLLVGCVVGNAYNAFTSGANVDQFMTIASTGVVVGMLLCCGAGALGWYKGSKLSKTDSKWLKAFNKTKPNTPERKAQLAILFEQSTKDFQETLKTSKFWLEESNYFLYAGEKYVDECLAAHNYGAELLAEEKPQLALDLKRSFEMAGITTTRESLLKRMAELPAERERRAERVREMLMKSE